MLRHHADELPAVLLRHPVLGLDALSRGDSRLEGSDFRRIIGRYGGAGLSHAASTLWFGSTCQIYSRTSPAANTRTQPRRRRAPRYLILPLMLTRPAIPGTSVAGGDVSITIADGIG